MTMLPEERLFEAADVRCCCWFVLFVVFADWLLVRLVLLAEFMSMHVADLDMTGVTD